MGIQQRPHKRRRRMESGLPHPRRTLRANSHVLRTNQLPSYLPNDDEHDLPSRNRPRMAVRLHGRLGHPHETETGRNRGTTPTEASKPRPPYPRNAAKTRPLPQTREVLFRTGRDRLPWGHRRQGQAGNGPSKVKRRRRLASAQKPHGRPLLPRIHRVLPILRPQLFQGRSTPPGPNQKALSVALGRVSTQGLRNPENPYVPKASPHPARLRTTLLPTNRRLSLWDWSSA